MPWPVDPKFIREAEGKLGVRFPPEFLHRMAMLNGGEAEAVQDVWQIYPVLDSSDRKRLSRTCNDVCHETAYLRQNWSRFPPEAVAIAGNGGGDQLVLLPAPSEDGLLGSSVFFWDHETGALTCVAEDFGKLKFLSSARRGNGPGSERS